MEFLSSSYSKSMIICNGSSGKSSICKVLWSVLKDPSSSKTSNPKNNFFQIMMKVLVLMETLKIHRKKEEVEMMIGQVMQVLKSITFQ